MLEMSNLHSFLEHRAHAAIMLFRAIRCACLPAPRLFGIRKRVHLTALFVLGLIVTTLGARAEPTPENRGPLSVKRDLPSVQQMIEARTDVWGDAAREQPNGASYEFFANLLPPLRWVNTDFRHYPLVLSARAVRKRRGWCRMAAA